MRHRLTSLFLITGLILGCQIQLKAADQPGPLEILVRSLDKTEDSAIRVALMHGMLNAFEGRRNVPAPPQWEKVSAKLAKSEDKTVRDLTQQLSQVFGDEAATQQALETLQDRSAKFETRDQALRSLLSQQNDKVSALLESLLDQPEMRLAAIRGYVAIENQNAPEIFVSQVKPPYGVCVEFTEECREGSYSSVT